MKAQIQFNWIFVIIVGALILLFFTGFVIKYKELQEKKQEIILLNNFDSALKSLERSSFKTSTSLNLFKEIEVSCNENVFINDKETNNLLFSDNKLKSKILIWYQPYKLPFFITNFYYIIDDKKYYLVVDNNEELNNFVDNLIDDLPTDFKEKVEKTNIYNNEDKKNKYISFIGDGDIQVIPSADYEYGKIRVNNIDYEFYGRELLYGAIFSEDYPCISNIVESKIDNAILMYQNKISIIKRNNCNYNSILNELENLKQDTNKNTVDNIEDLNQNLASTDCAVLY